MSKWWNLKSAATHQSFGLVLIFVVVQLVSSQDEPARVPGLHEASLLPEPTAAENVLPGRSAAVLRAVARAASLLVHDQTQRPSCTRNRGGDRLVLAYDITESVIWVSGRCSGNNTNEGHYLCPVMPQYCSLHPCHICIRQDKQILTKH